MSKTSSPGTPTLAIEVLALIGFVILLMVSTALGLLLISKNRPTDAPAPTLVLTTSALTQSTLTASEAVQVTPLGDVSPNTSTALASQTSTISPQIATIISAETPTPSVSPVANPTATSSALGPTAGPSLSPSTTPEVSATPSASSSPINPASPTAPLASPTASASSTLAATITPQALNNGWQLLSYTIAPDPAQANALLVYGELLNANANHQEISSITGSVLDSQGQIVVTGSALVIYTPVTTIPSGSRVPFEITVANTAAGSTLSLNVQSAATSETWRQELSAIELAQVNEGDDYCVKGRISNSGAALQEALIIAVKLYDAAGRLINFSDFTPNSPSLVVGDQTLPFIICANPPNRGVALYEIQTWGR